MKVKQTPRPGAGARRIAAAFAHGASTAGYAELASGPHAVASTTHYSARLQTRSW